MCYSFKDCKIRIIQDKIKTCQVNNGVHNNASITIIIIIIIIKYYYYYQENDRNTLTLTDFADTRDLERPEPPPRSRSTHTIGRGQAASSEAR